MLFICFINEGVIPMQMVGTCYDEEQKGRSK